MTTKHLTGAYPAGYALDPIYDSLVLKPTASVGGTGILASALATVTNFGTVHATAAPYVGIHLEAGGAVTNGSAAHTTALIESLDRAIEVDGAAATVANFGTILSGGGVYLADGGSLTNGSVSDLAALIEDTSYSFGLNVEGAFTSIRNFGTIESVQTGLAVGIGGSSRGASVTNGSANDTGALFEGGEEAIAVQNGPVTVTNFGTILSEHGVAIVGAIRVTNGSETDTAALIEGSSAQQGGNGEGVFAGGSATVTNFGTIYGIAGAALTGGGRLTNGSATDRTALIEGYIEGVLSDAATQITNYGTIQGIRAYGVAAGPLQPSTTLVNFGTIIGVSAAVDFVAAGNRLVVEAGSSLIGAALGDGSTLELAAASGTITALGAGGTISGGQSGTVSGFGSYVFDARTSWTLAGTTSLAAGQSVTAAKGASVTAGGAITNAGTLAALGGTLTVLGAVTGAGVAVIDGGTLDFAASFNEAVSFTGGKGRLELAQSRGYTATVTGFSKTGGTAFDLADIGFVSSGEATYSGGILTVTDGAHTASIALAGPYRRITFVAASDGHGGTLVTAVPPPSTPPLPSPAAFASAAASLAHAAAAPIHQAAEGHGQARLLARPVA